MPSRNSNRELWLSFFAILGISIAYVIVVTWFDDIPAASGFFGHSIGILGFVLMLMTETLYSIRKRVNSARWGRMAEWLDFHIFTGVVGPFMVLIHSSWKFNGLAGVVTLLTAAIVGSGFIGRYIYTAVPRNVDGIEISVDQLNAEFERTNQSIQRYVNTSFKDYPKDLIQQFLVSARPLSMPFLWIIGGSLMIVSFRLRWWLSTSGLPKPARDQARRFEELFIRKQRYYQQIAVLGVARRSLALWHSIHIPLGMVLFAAAFIHILAAIYYATLLR
jgi:hypothetical protein